MKRLRLGERDRDAGQPPGGHGRAGPVALEARAHPRGQHIGHHEPAVVPVARVLGTRVTEPGDQPAIIGHALTGSAAPDRRRLLGAAASGAAPSSAAAAAGAAAGDAPRHPPPPRPRAAPSSASICSAVGAAITCSTRMSGSTASVTPLGSVRSPACTDVPISMPSMSTSMPGGMFVASASTAIWIELLVQQAVRGHLAGHRDRDLDGDLLAAPDHDQVDVLDGALDRRPAAPPWAAQAGCRRAGPPAGSARSPCAARAARRGRAG